MKLDQRKIVYFLYNYTIYHIYQLFT